MHRSLDQIRADTAYRSVQEHLGVDGFVDLAQRLPTILQRSGLLATWAFLQAKSAKQESARCIIGVLLAHLRSTALHLHTYVPSGDGAEVFRHWVGQTNGRPNISGGGLRRLTDEALGLAGWLKRAAEAYGEIS